MYPYLSPTLPQIGEKIKAVKKVIPKTKPAHLWTYSVEKSPIVLIYRDRKGMTIVVLDATKKLANHMMTKFFVSRLINITFSKYYP